MTRRTWFGRFLVAVGLMKAATKAAKEYADPMLSSDLTRDSFMQALEVLEQMKKDEPVYTRWQGRYQLAISVRLKGIKS